MIRLLVASFLFVSASSLFANTIIVTNLEELNAANKKAVPGDIIILKNGDWKEVSIKLTAKGTKDHPVIFRAETPGKVIISGNSSLKIGGNYIVVDGFFFTNGSSGKDAVISFRTDSKNVANNCRVTNTAINSFNNARRLDDNNWVLLYGKNNKLDHCSFKDKNNMGVLLAVILDDERSRENFHIIENNYFGRRVPLGSNGGEIIRVGVSQHCQFNSNTQILNNFFEECDGEAEIVSIKSCSNVVKGNLFRESQGSVVLRHGDYNTVENNIFIGNNKPGTGGIRVVNKGQWVVNNFLYGCRGIDFRSPLTVMNGIPNSPANRYVQVTDAVIANNTFYNCSPASFCDGSDAERSLAPDNVVFANNLFYNTKDSTIYRAFDDLSGFLFAGNIVHPETNQQALPGFSKKRLSFWKYNGIIFPTEYKPTPLIVNDSLNEMAIKRIGYKMPLLSGFSDLSKLKEIHSSAVTKTGVNWNWNTQENDKKVKTVSCSTAADIYAQLENNEPVIIRLSGHTYELNLPIIIRKAVTIHGNSRTEYKFKTGNISSVFIIAGGGKLELNNVKTDGSMVNSNKFIATDSTGSTAHYNLTIRNSTFRNFTRENGTVHFFYSYKTSFADSLLFLNNSFIDTKTDHFIMTTENDNKGLYAAEKIVFSKNNFSNTSGSLLEIYRGGNDESTLGPNLTLNENKFTACRNDGALVKLTGVQRSNISQNYFDNCVPGGKLIEYIDLVRAYHHLESNEIYSSGKIETNNFVISSNNNIK